MVIAVPPAMSVMGSASVSKLSGCALAKTCTGKSGGSLRHQGGFELLWDGGRQSLVGFELVPASDGAWETTLFELRAADGSVPFFLDAPHHQLLPGLGQLVFLNMDLRLSEELARRAVWRYTVGLGLAHGRCLRCR